jgi:hypothetical protein
LRTFQLKGQKQAGKVEKAALPHSQEQSKQQWQEEMRQLAEIFADMYADISGEPEVTDSSIMLEKIAA